MVGVDCINSGVDDGRRVEADGIAVEPGDDGTIIGVDTFITLVIGSTFLVTVCWVDGTGVRVDTTGVGVDGTGVGVDCTRVGVDSTGVWDDGTGVGVDST